MKKTFLFSLGLILAFSSLFVSCSDNNGDNDKNSSLICQISVSNTDGGSAKITNYIGSSANVLIGNGVEVVATPDNGYNFLGWYLGNSDVGENHAAINYLKELSTHVFSLDDKLIEYIKLKTFKDEDATPFEDVNIVFESADNHSFFFAKMDSNNNIIAHYEVNRKEYDDICFDDCLNRWQCINRYTINRYIKKEN